MPTVTVLMAVFNGARFLREAIDSVLAQSFAEFEFLIIDDASVDETHSIISSYQDHRIKPLRNERNLGLARSLNRGLAVAGGEFIARLDADDVCEPERLERQVSFLRTHSAVGLVGSWYKEVDAEGRPLRLCKLPVTHHQLLWSMFFHCPFLHSAAMIRKAAIEQVGPYDERLAYSMDFELWRRLSGSWEIANVNDYLVRWRKNEFSMTATFGLTSEEGHRMRLARLEGVLGWNDDAAINDRKLRVLSSMAIWPQCSITPAEVQWGTSELFRLHQLFCEHHGFPGWLSARYRKKLLLTLARNLFVAQWKHKGPVTEPPRKSKDHAGSLTPLSKGEWLSLRFSTLVGCYAGAFFQGLRRPPEPTSRKE